MRPEVRNLYKQLLFLGRDYPAGLPTVREKVKNAFLKNKNLETNEEIKKAIAFGQYIAQEMEALIKLKKYRTLRRNYVLPKETGEE